MGRDPNKPSPIHPVGLLAVIVAAGCFCGTASAKVIFAQTGSETSTANGSNASDSDSGFQVADDVTLATAATVRSVKWWGTYGPFEETPVAPFSFQLIFYGDSGGLPDTGNVLSSTTVQFETLPPPAENIPDYFGDTIYYEFRANITPTAIPAGIKVWFSVLANTTNDANDDFLLRMDDLGNCASRTGLTSAFVSSVNERVLFALYDTTVRPVSTILADDFVGSGGLHDSVPEQRPGTETWIASADWQAAGMTLSVNSNSEDDSAFLPFTPLAGKIYTLSATLQQPSGGYSTSSTNAWAAIGFTAGSNTGSFTASPNAPSPWMQLLRTGHIRTLPGPGTAGSLTEAIYSERRIIKVVLDTTSNNWTAEWLVGLRSLRKITFTTKPTINFIGIAREDGVAVNFEAISLTVENGDIPPTIISFSPAGGNTWEMELLANPVMPFELRSSTNLDFSPGSLIENLTQGNPGTDPGTISGPNSKILTTDANGRAKVRFVLTGHPRDFVLALSLP